jgi:hypothetical protein
MIVAGFMSIGELHVHAITRSRKRLAVLAVAAVLVLGGGAAAFAFWTSAGGGSGAATPGTSTAFTVASTAATGVALVPGGTAQSVGFTVTNPGTASQALNLVAVTVANTDGTAWTAVPGCSAADYTIGTPVVTYGTMLGGSNKTGTVSVTMIDTGVNQDACKGVAVPLYFVAN